jgi:hypothetical protein
MHRWRTCAQQAGIMRLPSHLLLGVPCMFLMALSSSLRGDFSYSYSAPYVTPEHA